MERLALHRAAHRGRAADVAALFAAGADVNELMTNGITALIIACQMGHTEVVAKLLAANADVNLQASDTGLTALMVACQKGHAEVVPTLIAANADVNQANSLGGTPLYLACQNGHIEVIAKLLAANADVEKIQDYDHDDITAMNIACHNGHLGVVQILSSYGASRTFVDFETGIPFRAPYDTAEHVATDYGHHQLAVWLRMSRDWTPLHHLEFLTPERALALLRAGADIHAGAESGVRTPLSLAQAMAAAGGAAEGTAAFLVLEAAKPWSRKTHKYFPAPARERAVELLRVGQWFKRLPNDFPIPFEVWEVFVMPHEVTRDYEPPTRPQSPAPQSPASA